MSKFVTITDVHLRLTTPRSRTDKDWSATLMAKLDFVYAKARDIGASAVLISGDLGDNAEWSPKALVLFMGLLNKYKGIKTVVTIGQHDVFGHKIDEYKYTGIGVLSVNHAIEVLRDGQSVTIDGVTIIGFGFNEQITLGMLDGSVYISSDHHFSIGLVHASVGPDDCMGWAGISKQNPKGINLLSFGDIHCGFEPHKFPSGTVGYSTGSLGRASSADIGRQPCFAIVDVNPSDKTFELEFVDIPCTPDRDAFYPECFEDKVSAEEEQGIADTFKQILESARKMKDESTKEQLGRVGKEQDIKAEAIALAISYAKETENE